MKKSWIITLSCILAVSLSAGTALAKPGQAGGASGTNKKAETGSQAKSGRGQGNQKAEHASDDKGGNQAKESDQGKESDEGKEMANSDKPQSNDGKDGDKGKGHGNSASKANEETKGKQGAKEEEDKPATVTSETYGPGHKGYKGLLKAIENVKDKPAGAVLADLLLTKYDAQLTDEMKTELEGIEEAAQALTKAADMLEQTGSVTDAIYVQKEAVLTDITSLESYKKLGKLYDKLGKKGVKLYVNGEEPATEVAPIVKDGSTLVPFRAISEALQAEVTYDPSDKSITVTKDGVTLKLIINSKTAYKNGVKQTLDAPATVIGGSTVVPVRFIGEAFETSVKWEPETQSVIIYNEVNETSEK
ncbi:copper amine oxidase N-terminal domain-containing protein [Paenibacillus sp. TH7-28]